MTDRGLVLVVEDEKPISDLLRLYLTREGFGVHAEFDGVGALTAARTRHPVAIVLDVGLPGIDGTEVCRQLRAEDDWVPVIFCTARDDEVDRVLGLELGADDYVTKPFKFPVLLARIRAQLRQHEQSEDAVFQLGPYTFRPSMKVLITEDEKKIRLTEKETNILKFLYRSSDGVVARDVLLHEVWGYNAGVTTHTLETHIYRLRQKIEPDPSNARLLVTESGGYRLVA